MCPKSAESALGKKFLFTPISRVSSGPHTDTTQGQKGAERSHTKCKCTEPYGNYNDVYVLSIDQRVNCELREAFSEMSYALFTPHPDYSEEGG